MPKRVEALLRRSTFFVQPTIRTKLSCYLIKTGHLFPQQRKIIFSHRDGASLSRARGGFRILRTLWRWPPHRNAIGVDSEHNSLKSDDGPISPRLIISRSRNSEGFAREHEMQVWRARTSQTRDVRVEACAPLDMRPPALTRHEPILKRSAARSPPRRTIGAYCPPRRMRQVCRSAH